MLILDRFWPVIDDALRRVAFDRGIRVYLLASYWNYTDPNMPVFLKSLNDLNKIHRPKMNIQVVRVSVKHIPACILTHLSWT